MRSTILFVVAAVLASVLFGQAAQPVQDRVMQFNHTGSVQDFQEAVTLIRTIADIRQVTADNAPKTLSLRGTPEQIALAGWLYNELDQPIGGQPLAQHSATPEYRVSDNDVVRVFYAAPALPVQAFAELAIVLRSTSGIRRVFTYNAPRAIALRGTTDQLTLAEWLFNELDKPAAPPTSQSLGPHEYLVTADDVVRVFYVTGATEAATTVRSTANIPRVFIYNPPGAIVVRATAAQISVAGRLVKERDR